VHDGIVTLTGRADTERVGHELMAALRHIDGVIAVRDRLSYAGVAG
jgi:osmotically-inducible protein OsmY